ncbi:hypothetical protein OZX74_06785 [Bifidobacterium sp. ESL0798]|uniref:hypothetical protein n=1 Tax=Bifidobacterium sp. ESL0798 TaxID=2983235 RepID=UPI0023F92984|nr:hypothetical protein [Bifidobacterium sp. ESL0798]WEV73617.1 hypothetical protein OZX74_06785 [Bifidobacterium sp. ESL0798]
MNGPSPVPVNAKPADSKKPQAAAAKAPVALAETGAGVLGVSGVALLLLSAGIGLLLVRRRV